jgi:WD40 repeat protein
LRLFEGHTDSILCMSIADGYVLTGSVDRTIRVWNLREAEEEEEEEEEGSGKDACAAVVGPLADAVASIAVVRNVLLHGDVNGRLCGVF